VNTGFMHYASIMPLLYLLNLKNWFILIINKII